MEKKYIPFIELMKMNTPEAKKKMLGDTHEYRVKALERYPVLQEQYVEIRQKYGDKDPTIEYLHKELCKIENEYLLKSPFEVGKMYQLVNGEIIKLVGVTNEGTPFETMYDENGHHRYTTRDFGRCTGAVRTERNIDLRLVDMTGFSLPLWWTENQSSRECIVSESCDHH